MTNVLGRRVVVAACRRVTVATVWVCASQGDVGVFLPRVDLLLAGQHLQVSADLLASGRWLDDVIHKT